MTQPITSAKPIQQVYPLHLGEVTFKGHTYLAILHYCGEDGKELLIPNGMTAAKDKYCQVLQHMLDKAGENETPNTLLTRVSSGGFIFAADGKEESSSPISFHPQLKTAEVWGEFLVILENPQLAPDIIHSKSSIELIKIDDFNCEKRKELFGSISGKVTTALLQKSSRIKLTLDEKRFLGFYGCHCMKKGTFNKTEQLEWANLQSVIAEELSSSKNSQPNT